MAKGDRVKKIVAWDREFQVWHYSVSHSTLLLRSFDPDLYDTRVDVVFPAVSLMCLEPTYSGLEIHQAGDNEISAVITAERELNTGGSVYLLNGGRGYVCAAKVAWFEDEGDHRAPSRFGPLPGTK
jgi:hypothetical protein